jgi:hypothetical protein
MGFPVLHPFRLKMSAEIKTIRVIRFIDNLFLQPSILVERALHLINLSANAI